MQVFDLLNEKKKLCVLEDGNQVVQVGENECCDVVVFVWEMVCFRLLV